MVSRGRTRNDGWVPRQHGAWAMLVVPFLVAACWRGMGRGADIDDTGWIALVTLFVAWMVGYFAFNAASLWLKARAPRRERFVRPLSSYAGLAAAAGVVTLALEPAYLSWAPLYAVVTALTLWLVHRGDERSVPSGLLTTFAAASMATTVLSPQALDSTADEWALAAVFAAYFAGTVFYVKTLIRERGKPGWIVASVGWHLAALVGAVVLALRGGVEASSRWGAGAWWAFAAFFAVMAVRAVAVPLLGPMRGRRVTPKAAGIGEAVFSVAIAVLALAV